jgi:hypothetical protein
MTVKILKKTSTCVCVSLNRICTLPLFRYRASVPMKLFGNFQAKHSKRVKMWSPLGRHDVHARGWKQTSGSMARPRANLAKPDARCGVKFPRPHGLFMKETETSAETDVRYIKGAKTTVQEPRDDFILFSQSAISEIIHILAFGLYHLHESNQINQISVTDYRKQQNVAYVSVTVKQRYLSCKVHTTAKMTVLVFWVVTPCRLVGGQ